MEYNSTFCIDSISTLANKYQSHRYSEQTAGCQKLGVGWKQWVNYFFWGGSVSLSKMKKTLLKPVFQFSFSLMT